MKKKIEKKICTLKSWYQLVPTSTNWYQAVPRGTKYLVLVGPNWYQGNFLTYSTVLFDN